MRTDHSGMVFTDPDAYLGIDVRTNHNCCVGVDGVEHGVKGGTELLMFCIIAGEECQDEGNRERFAFDTLPAAVEGVKFDVQLDELPCKVIIGVGDRWRRPCRIPCLIELGEENDTNPFEEVPFAIFPFGGIPVKDVIASNINVEFIAFFPCLLH